MCTFAVKGAFVLRSMHNRGYPRRHRIAKHVPEGKRLAHPFAYVMLIGSIPLIFGGLFHRARVLGTLTMLTAGWFVTMPWMRWRPGGNDPLPVAAPCE